MNTGLRCLMVLWLLGGVAPSCLAAPSLDTADPSIVRDIRDPAPLSGLPPFAGTALVLVVAGIGLAATRIARKERPVPVSPLAVPSIGDELALLQQAHDAGELPVALLCERLSRLIAERLTVAATGAMTSSEVLAAAGDVIPDDLLNVASSLLACCDRVRFGNYQPSTAAIGQMLAETRLLLGRLPEAAP